MASLIRCTKDEFKLFLNNAVSDYKNSCFSFKTEFVTDTKFTIIPFINLIPRHPFRVAYKGEILEDETGIIIIGKYQSMIITKFFIIIIVVFSLIDIIRGNLRVDYILLPIVVIVGLLINAKLKTITNKLLSEVISSITTNKSRL